MAKPSCDTDPDQRSGRANNGSACLGDIAGTPISLASHKDGVCLLQALRVATLATTGAGA